MCLVSPAKLKPNYIDLEKFWKIACVFFSNADASLLQVTQLWQRPYGVYGQWWVLIPRRRYPMWLIWTAGRLITYIYAAHWDLGPPLGFTVASASHRTHSAFSSFIHSVLNLTMLKSDYFSILGTLVVTAFICVRMRRRSTLPLPPGPKKLPLLGNLFNLPTSYKWLAYTRLCKEYSTH